MKKIRAGFETNSSSAHSFVVDFSDDSPLQEIALLGFKDENNILNVTGETRFGWKWHVWNYPGDKANYLFIDNMNNNERIQRLKDILANNTGADDVIFSDVEDDCSGDVCKYYIDHQSYGTSEKIFELSDDQIWEFLMNPHCLFRGGNDNEEGPWDIKNRGL